MALLLFTVSSADNKNKLLGLIILLYSFSLVDNVWYWSGYYKGFPHLLGISMPFPFLYGSVLYLYFKESIRSNSVSFRANWLHMVLPILIITYYLPYYAANSEMKLKKVLTWNSNPFNAMVIPLLEMTILMVYGYLMYKAIKCYQDRLKIKIVWSKNWLFQVWIIFCFFTLLSLSYYYVVLLGYSTSHTDYIVAIGSASFIYFIGYLGFSKSKLLNGIKANELKYQSSTLTTTAGDHLFAQVKNYMEETRIYTNNQLRLAHLADQMSITTHQLSQIINEHSGMNFSDFINAYRIEEAKRQINKKTIFNLLAFDVGFNNKTSFNLAFKKFAGCTPSEYRDKQSHSA